MTNLVEDLFSLSRDCFSIEEKLDHWWNAPQGESLSDEQFLRLALYRIRIEIGKCQETSKRLGIEYQHTKIDTQGPNDMITHE